MHLALKKRLYILLLISSALLLLLPWAIDEWRTHSLRSALVLPEAPAIKKVADFSLTATAPDIKTIKGLKPFTLALKVKQDSKQLQTLREQLQKAGMTTYLVTVDKQLQLFVGPALDMAHLKIWQEQLQQQFKIKSEVVPFELSADIIV